MISEEELYQAKTDIIQFVESHVDKLQDNIRYLEDRIQVLENELANSRERQEKLREDLCHTSNYLFALYDVLDDENVIGHRVIRSYSRQAAETLLENEIDSRVRIFYIGSTE